jgi:hypothetical protein
MSHHWSIGSDYKWTMATHKDSYKTVSNAFAKLARKLAGLPRQIFSEYRLTQTDCMD